MRMNTTEAEFRKKIENSNKLSDFKSIDRDPAIVKPEVKQDAYADCILLYDGSSHTMVPNGSVLALPANFRNRIIDKPKGRLVLWPDFVEKNKSWLGAWEVPMTMVRGDAEQSKAIMKQISQDSRVLVAVFKGSPITVLEPVPEETSKTSGASRE